MSLINTIMSQGPTGYWPLAAGATQRDVSGNGRHLTAVGTTPTTLASAMFLRDSGGGAYFTNSTAYATNASWNQLSTASVGIWFRTGDAGSGHRGLIMKHGKYGMFLFSNQLCVYNWGNGTNNVITGTKNDNAWHFAFVNYQSGVNNGTTVYLDNVLVGTLTVSNGTDPAGDELDFHVGSGGFLAEGGTTLNGQSYSGDLAHAVHFNRVLTAGEMTAQYQTAYYSGVVNGS